MLLHQCILLLYQPLGVRQLPQVPILIGRDIHVWEVPFVIYRRKANVGPDFDTYCDLRVQLAPLQNRGPLIYVFLTTLVVLRW